VADPDAVFAILGDESAGLFFAGPAYADAFHAWLADEAGGSGVAPADLGVASFDDVAPLEDMGWWLVPERRPDPSVDAAAARRWVWALRFWNVATARAFAVALDELETAVGGDVAAAINSGTPIAAGYFQYAYGTEYQTMMAQRGVDAFFGEGFLSYLDNCLAWDLGFYGDWVAGQLEPWGSGASRPRAATYLHAYRGDSGRKMLELAGRGFTWFNHYAYGTFDLSTGDGAGGFGAGSVPWLERVASGSELLAKAEPALAGAAREPSPIVMLGSQSDPVWSDLPAASDDEIGWHMALVQSHYPIDIMPESEIEAGRLEGPAAPKRLLFVLRKHVSKAAFTAIRRWVEAGGTLVLGPDLASHDEYGQLDVARAEWLAVAPGPEHAAAAHQSLQWATDEGLVTFFYEGGWRELVGIGGTTLAVAGDDERPIALRLARGRGRVVALGVALGETYRRPTLACGSRPSALPPEYPDAFADAMRAAMASVPASVGLAEARPVWSDDARVSLQAVTGPNGPAVIAVAWADGPVDVALTAPAWQGCSRVHDVVGDADLPVIFGSVLAPIERAAVLTWDPDECQRPSSPEADDTAEDPPKKAADDGCATGLGPAWMAALVLVGAALARASRRARDH
ncbi:MAG: hypothetical protein U1F43_39100, partial [Myxococcota bacterium]